MNNIIEDSLKDLELRLISRIKGWSNLSYAEQVRLAVELDTFKELQSLGLTSIVDELEQNYANIIKEVAKAKVSGINPISLENLQLIADLDSETILRSGQMYGAEFKSRLLKGMIAGENTNQILSDSRIPGFKHNWNITAITTAEDEFHSLATAEIYKDEPETKFKLAGANDPRTRPECRAVLEHQPKDGFTKADVDKGLLTKIAKRNYMNYTRKPLKDDTLSYTWTFRGGFNCRHRFEPV